jgi:hypothetical protein
MSVKLCAFALGFICLAATSSHAGYCRIVGHTGDIQTSASGTSPGPLNLSNTGVFPSGFCGKTVYATTGTCYLNMDTNGSVSAGHNSCLVLGNNTTLTTDGVNNTIDCPGAYCDNAISTTTAYGGGAVKVDNVNITGCWAYALLNSGTGNTVTNSTVDFGSGCTLLGNGSAGISQWATADQNTVSGATWFGIAPGSGTVSNSVVHDCEIGVELGSSAAVVNNVLLYDNTFSIYYSSLYGSNPNSNLKSSVLNDSCPCTRDGNVCGSGVTDCVDLSGDLTFINNAIP